MPETKRVLVLGDNDLACLTTVRSLGRAGLEVHLVAWYAHAITRASRYVHHVHRCGHPDQDPHQFTQKVLSIIQEIPFDLVIPVVDAALIPLLPIIDTIRRYCVFAAPTPQQFELAHNKAETIRLARQLGVDTPQTTVITQLSQISSISWPKGFPIILKPALGGRVRRGHNYGEAEQKLEQMLRHGPVLVQEFCPGRGIGIDVLSEDGIICAAFQHERVHEPPEGGVSSYRKSIPLSHDLLATVRRMCASLQWTGPAMFEFKIDPVSGRTVLMEINGRLWGSLALSVAAGVDFPKLIYDRLVRRAPVEVFSYRIPCFSRNTLRDFFWLLDNLKTPSNNPHLLKVKWPALLKEFRNILLGREHLDAEQLSDPLPGLLSWVEVGREISARLSTKIATTQSKVVARRMATQARKQDPQLVQLLRQARSALFLCQGNIHRSAFAEQMAQKNCHWQDDLQLASAGFIPDIGRQTSQYSLQVAKTFDIDLSRHRSRLVTKGMLDHADIIFVMDRNQLQQLRTLDFSVMRKTVLLGALDPQTTDWEIADPDGKSAEFYYQIYTRISRVIFNWLHIRYEGQTSISPITNSDPRQISSPARQAIG